MAHSCTQFFHRRGPPTRTQAGSKRGKRPRIQRRPRARVPGPAHERPMGSSQEEGLPCQPSQPDHDTDSDDTDATGPPAALLEGLLLGDGKPSPHSTRPGPFFYIGGNNGAAMLGRDTAAPTLEDLPWTSPGHLRPQRVLRMEEFFPETYRLDLKHEREAFSTLFDAQQPRCGALRYIQNPLLLDGRKFDVRSYLLIACTTPYMIFFSHGYARLTLSLYDPHSSDLSGHLTNQFMQKKSPLYALLKEDTVWSMEHLNRYINTTFWKARGLPKDWVFTTLTKRMQQIMAHCFLAAKSKLECKLGYFDLIGCDFLIDDNFKVWLLEMNSNPALHTNCEVLKEVIPGVVIETLVQIPTDGAIPPSLPGPTPDPDSAHDGQPQAPGKEHSGTGDRHPEQEPSPGTAKEERKEPENARP
ncbi:PREDICTED: inactive polyglycylase TTLL10 [Mandrillus leucophaeus]|uniref:inactive polyglycylase TTLL10 n=1 Tax=Mandrillus leucophaeus TaxID=9568 RepID=UPI0005F4793D|nr:PREDICTED: inactive polyglycylase TTLL10 [Mandrillus leucophaeus]